MTTASTEPSFRSVANFLADSLDVCSLVDQRRLSARLKKLKTQSDGDNTRHQTQQLAQAIEQARIKFLARKQCLPVPTFSNELPINARRDEIKELIENNQVMIVSGETGSGKSTQLPKICLELNRGLRGQIAHTQPRRIAARAIAQRVSEELGSQLGDAVGYKVRFDEKASSDSFIKVLTDGMLLAEIEQDRFLNQYDTIIVDEAHERSLNIDFLLGCLKRLLPKRPDLKLIVTSATIDTQKFSEFFGKAPVIEVSGRMYPVETIYRSLDESQDEDDTQTDLNRAIVDAAKEAAKKGPGDVLVFLPGEREIREATDAVRKYGDSAWELLPLYARLSPAEQQRVFKTSGKRRIVLATNVAETSLTVPGIRFVIDSGLARISRYSASRKVLRLPIERISQASANQRAGRCGRVSSGICYRLYNEQTFEQLAPFTDPEILRTSLAGVILKMKAMRLGELAEFPFLNKPDSKQVNAGIRLLQELGALDGKKSLTHLGKRLSRFPVDPRIGRILLAGEQQHCLEEMLILAAALSIPDPRLYPHDQRERAREKHRLWIKGNSDFIGLMNLWSDFHKRREILSQRKLRQFCEEHFISYMRMREWRELHRQLARVVKDNKLKVNPAGANEERNESAIHTAILTGLLGNIALKDQNREYKGSHGKKLLIEQSSALYPTGGKWIVAAEVTDTGRLYARSVAAIKPQWIERAAEHQLKKSYSEPHFDERENKVKVFENATLYGLPVVSRRRRDYGPVNAGEARIIFIREGLVDGKASIKQKFYRENLALAESIKSMENKLRRRDLLVHEDKVYEFYDSRIPQTVIDAASLTRWLKQDTKAEDTLIMNFEDLAAREEEMDIVSAFPDRAAINGIDISFQYEFEPTQAEDGVTAKIPLYALNGLSSATFDYAVPGWNLLKIDKLLRTLPKALRKQLVPIPETAAKIADDIQRSGDHLLPAVTQALTEHFNLPVATCDFRIEELPVYLRTHFELIDNQNQLLAKGDSLDQLKKDYGKLSKTSFEKDSKSELERNGIKTWDFGDLPEHSDVEIDGRTVRGFPGVVDNGSSVAIKSFSAKTEAAGQSVAGVRKLILLALPEQKKMLERQLPQIDKLCLLYTLIGQGSQSSQGGLCSELKQSVLENVMEKTFSIQASPIRTKQEFEKRVEQGRGELVENTNRLCNSLIQTLTLNKDLSMLFNNPLIQMKRDNRGLFRHRDRLLFAGFVKRAPFDWLLRYPIYLKTLRERADTLLHSPDKEGQRSDRLESFELKLLEAEQQKSRFRNEHEITVFRWMFEEFTVSVFAQKLKTLMPVSEARLEKQWQKCFQ